MFRNKKENHSPMENHNSSQVTVVMVPLAAQGHLNQLLHLSRLVAAYNIPVHYVGATTHIRQARLRLHGCDLPNIHFIEFPIPPFTTPPPDHSLKFPTQLVPALTATTHLRRPFHAFVGGLSTAFRRIIVIYDALMSYVVQDMASFPNVHCYLFRSFSCFCTCAWEAQKWPDLPPAASGILNQIPSVKGYYSKEFQDFLDLQFGANKVSCGEIINSCSEIEGLYLDLWAQGIYKKGGLTLWAMGPFNPAKISRKSDHECLKWLNKQPQNSVIFISFGTTTTFSEEQMGEIAAGLERSKQRFIWVVRGADRGDIFTRNSQQQLLPEGFEERVKKRGIVVREWAPQMEILGHPSTGGFMSHCGWNSCLESITSGVPMATWPMHSDQPANAVLVARVIGIGVEVVETWTRQGTGVVEGGRVEEVVKRLMVSTEGEGMRKRAAELGARVRNSILQSRQIQAFIAHITNI
ncbi:zeatin O-xylosyltransferase-like [Salvia splendens]|nr:zeatin O-xylosyltransferase-like [Salvia splendens]